MSAQLIEEAIELHKKGLLKKADLIYRKILEKNPDDYKVLCLRGLVAQSLNKKIEAISFFYKAFLIKKEDPEISFNLGLAYKEINNFEKSNHFYRKTIELNSEHLEAHVNLANNLTAQNLFKKASADYIKAIELNPSLSTTYFNLGTMYLKAMDPDSAVIFLEKATGLDQDSANALNALGVAQTEIGNLDEAIHSFEKAHIKNPEFIEPLFNLHMVYLDVGRSDLAILSLEKAKKISPNNATLDFFLAILFAYTKKEVKCQEILDKISKGKKIQAELASWSFIRNSSNSLPILTGTNYKSIELAIQHTNIDGLILEFGVFNGKSIRRIATLTDSKIYGFDSFEGLPEKWNNEPKGSYSAGGELPNVPGHVALIKGWFNESIPVFLNRSDVDAPIRLLHIDCDLYSSTKTILDLLHEKIIPGTVILFDEFIGYKSWQDDEFKAFMEAAKKYSWGYELILISFATKQVAIKIK